MKRLLIAVLFSPVAIVALVVCIFLGIANGFVIWSEAMHDAYIKAVRQQRPEL